MEEINLTLSPWNPSLVSLGVYILMVMLLAVALLFLSYWLNPRRMTPGKALPYECGIIPTGRARFGYPTPFYKVAAFFLIFDVETVYIVSWAVSFDELDLVIWLRMTLFIALLLVSLFYIWRKGGLDWEGVRP